MSQFTPRELPILSVPKKNASSSVTIPKGTIVKLDSTAEQVAPASAATDKLFGVAREDILGGGWGDILILGRALVLGADTSVSIGGRVTSDSSGLGVAVGSSAGTNYSVLGVAERASIASTLYEVMLTGPGASMQG